MNWINLAYHKARRRAVKNLPGWETVCLWRRTQEQEFSYPFLYGFIWSRSVAVIFLQSLLILIKKLHVESKSWLLYRNRQLQHSKSAVCVACSCLSELHSVSPPPHSTISILLCSQCAVCAPLTELKSVLRLKVNWSSPIIWQWRAKVCLCAGVWGTFCGYTAAVVPRSANSQSGPRWEIMYRVRRAGRTG